MAYERFASIGFADPEAAMRHVAVLTAGVSRASKINRILLPAVLQWLGQGQNPDMGLLNWRKLEERFGTDSEYLGFLRDSNSAAQRLCHVLSNSRFLGDALNKSVESVTWLGDDDALVARSRESLDVQCRSSLSRNADGINDFATSMRAMRRHEIERIGLARLSGVMDETACLTGMTDVYDAIIDAALTWAIRYQTSAMGLGEPPAAIAAIGMGRYGGQEVNFSSDADMILLYRPADGTDEQVANQFARKVVDALRQVLQGPTTLEPKIEIDLDLRPEGKNGPLIRSYASCREYYSSWANTWEHQALLRARFVAGDRALGEDFLHDIANPLRYPISPLTDAQLGEIRKLKARKASQTRQGRPVGRRMDRAAPATAACRRQRLAAAEFDTRDAGRAGTPQVHRPRGRGGAAQGVAHVHGGPQRQLPVERTRLAGRHPARRHVFAGRHRRVSGIRCPPWAAFRKRPDGNDAQGPRRGRASVLWTLI